MTGQGASPAYRIYHGDTIQATIWSNVAAAVDGFFRVVYDDGTTDTLRIDRSTTTSARAAFFARADSVAMHDGYVTEGVLFADSPQRGQTYAIVYIAQGDGPSDVRMAICKGYVYAFTPLAVGQQVEPGPAGGPGNLRLVTTATPSANTETPDAFAPTGAIWLIRSYTVVLTQGITQTPLPALEFESGATPVAVIPAMTTALGASTVARITWGIGLVQSSFTAVAGDEIYTAPLPVIYMTTLGGTIVDTIATVTDGIGANTSYSAATFEVEEWVMPN